MVTRPNVSTPKTDLTHQDGQLMYRLYTLQEEKIHHISGFLPLMLNMIYFYMRCLSFFFFFLISTWDIYPSHAPREIDETGPSELLTRPIIVSFNKEYHVHVNEKPKIIQEAGLHISCMVTSFVSFFQLLACCWDFSSWIFPSNSRG